MKTIHALIFTTGLVAGSSAMCTDLQFYNTKINRLYKNLLDLSDNRPIEQRALADGMSEERIHYYLDTSKSVTALAAELDSKIGGLNFCLNNPELSYSEAQIRDGHELRLALQKVHNELINSNAYKNTYEQEQQTLAKLKEAGVAAKAQAQMALEAKIKAAADQRFLEQEYVRLKTELAAQATT
jgi:hypothetical protein